MNDLKKWQGCLMGLAVGDAVGASVEFKERGTFKSVTDMNGGGPFNLPKGYYTDDTIMALCLADSLLYSDGFDPKDQMNRYVNWMDFGHRSPTGTCFDIGSTTYNALDDYKFRGNPYAGNTSNYSSGNGAIMRMAPIPMFFKTAEEVLYFANRMSATTHGSPFCLESAELFANVLHLALEGYSKEYILEVVYAYIDKSQSIKCVATNVFKHGFHLKHVDDIKGSGFVLESLEASLWCFFNTANYKDAVLKATNLGDDTDTTAAITGQLAGAFYGIDDIPDKWVKQIYNYQEILDISDKLFFKHENK